jgi:uncharacterized protein
MMNTFRWLAGGRWLVLMLWLLATAAFAEQPVPAFKAYVTDETGTLTAVQKNQLEQKLRAFTRQKGSQIAVLIVPTTQPETIEQYSMRVAESWKPGRKGVDDGVLFVLAKNDRKFRIEVGYGLEGVLPDAVSKRIDSEVIKPYFRKGDFYGGINAGIDSMIQTINQEKLPAKAPATQHSGGGGWLVFIGAVVLGFVLCLLLRPVYAGFSAGLAASLLGGIMGSMMFALGIGLLVFVLVYGVSMLYTMMKRAREEKPALATSPPAGSGYGGYTSTGRSDESDHGFATGLGTGIGLGSFGSSSSDSSSSGSDSSSSSDFGSSGGDFGGGGGGDFGGGGASDSF